MKILAIPGIFLGIFLLWRANDPELPPSPFVVPERTHLGDIEQLSIIESEITLHNPLEYSLVVVDVNTTCSCTVPELDAPTVIGAGLSIVVPVSFESRRSAGAKSNAVTFVLEKADRSIGEVKQQFVVRHILSAFVQPEIWVDGLPVEVGELTVGDVHHRELMIRARSDEYRIVDATSDREFLKIGESSRRFVDGSCTLPITFNLMDSDLDGKVGCSVSLKLEGGIVEKADVPLSTTFFNPLSVRPSVLTFSGNQGADAVKMSVKVRPPFEVSAVAGSSPDIEIETFRTQDLSTIYTVRLAEQALMNQESHLTVEAVHPGTSEKLRRVVPIIQVKGESR